MPRTRSPKLTRTAAIVVAVLLSIIYLFLGLVAILVAQYFTDGILENMLSFFLLVLAVFAVYAQLKRAFRK